MAHILGFLAPTWETLRKFQTPGFGLGQPKLPQAFGGVQQQTEALCLSLS